MRARRTRTRLTLLAAFALAVAAALVVLGLGTATPDADATSVAAERGTRALRAQSFTEIRVACRRGRVRALCRWQGARDGQRCQGTLTVGRERVRGRWVNVGRRPRCQAPAAPAPPPPPLVGFNTGGDLENVKLQLRTGAPVRRVNIEWSKVQLLPGVWNWTEYDGQYDAIVKAGGKPLIMVYLAPCWARPRTSCDALVGGPPDPPFDPAWAEFVRRAVKRYPKAIGFEIWNEPNLLSFWGPKPDPVRFAAVLKVAYRAVKEVDPAMTVVSGGLLQSTAQGYGPYSVGDQTFLRDTLAAGAGESLDAIGLHPYPVAQETPTQLRWDPAAMADSVERIRAARDEAGGRQPIWLTEFGISTAGQYGTPAAVDREQQAAQLGAMLDVAERSGDIPVAIVHTLVDQFTTPVDDVSDAVAGVVGFNATYNKVNSGFGVFDSNLRPKPAACALSRRLGGTLSC